MCIEDALDLSKKGNHATVKPPIKDTPKEDKPPNKGQAESASVYTLYRKITSERGQPLYKGQNGWSQKCPY